MSTAPPPALTLHQAALDGNDPQVRQLLKDNVDVNAHLTSNEPVDFKGSTALMCAALKDNTTVIGTLLAANADVNLPLISDGPIGLKGCTALTCAAFKGHAGAVEILLAANADPNALSIQYKATPLLEAATHGHADTVDMLLKANADPDATTRGNECTPLHMAAEPGYTNIVRMLLKAGASADTKNKSGETPLTLARDNGRIEVTELLKAAMEAATPKPFLSTRTWVLLASAAAITPLVLKTISSVLACLAEVPPEDIEEPQTYLQSWGITSTAPLPPAATPPSFEECMNQVLWG